MSVKIREVRAEDFEAWLPLWEGYNRFYGRTGPTALPPEITRTSWERFLDPREPMHAVVAESGDGKLVGLAHYLFHRSTILLELNCYLQDLYTDPASRGGGIGRSLIEEVYARALAAGSPRVYWQTHETNAAARRLYDRVAERSGFIVYRKTL